MRTIAPRIDGADEYVIAEDQHTYMPVTACNVIFADDPTIVRILRWTFTPEEREKVAKGEDIYFGTLAHIPLMPHWLRVGLE